MATNQRNGKGAPAWRKYWLWKLILLGCVAYIVFFSQGSFVRRWRAEKRARPPREALEAVEAQNDSLQEMNRRLEDENSFELEKQAREWGMISEGDTVYHFRSEREISQKN